MIGPCMITGAVTEFFGTFWSIASSVPAAVHSPAFVAGAPARCERWPRVRGDAGRGLRQGRGDGALHRPLPAGRWRDGRRRRLRALHRAGPGELSGSLNDAPCLPCTSHGASITQPFCVACHPTTAAHGGAWWRRRRGRTEPEGGGVLFTLPAAAGGKLLRPRSQLAQIALRQRVFCPRRGVWRPPGCCRDKNRG
jgi:hypothetical protein